jgi:hypothetical protein
MNTPELHFFTPTELLAALPHLLGFVPIDDMVALMVGPAAGDEDHAAMRAAIRCPITVDDELAQHFPVRCGLDAARFPGAMLIAVCDARHDERALVVLRTVRDTLHRRGIIVHRMLMTHSVTAPDNWFDPDTGQIGSTVAYTDSPATALGVVQGRLIAASRAQIQREFATTDPAPHLDAEAQDIVGLISDTAADLHHAITQNQAPTTDLAMRAALLVTAHVGLRDGLLRLAVGHELAAGRVWTQIAAAHRGRTRAELLTMAALAYYCGEDTMRAGMALTYAGEAVRDDDSTLPALAAMLYTALQAGMPPAKVRTVIPTRDKTPIPGSHLYVSSNRSDRSSPAAVRPAYPPTAVLNHSHTCTPTSHASTAPSMPSATRASQIFRMRELLPLIPLLSITLESAHTSHPHQSPRPTYPLPHRHPHPRSPTPTQKSVGHIGTAVQYWFRARQAPPKPAARGTPETDFTPGGFINPAIEAPHC